MSEINELIAKTTTIAYNRGIIDTMERVANMLDEVLVCDGHETEDICDKERILALLQKQN